MKRSRVIAAGLVVALAVVTAPAQNGNANDNSADVEIDACGVVVRGTECFFVQTAGGLYFVPDLGRFGEGDAVRVVGTIDADCITICGEGDGCIRGAELYDPAIFPCGTDLEVPFDPCSGLSAALSAAALVGFAFVRASRKGH